MFKLVIPWDEANFEPRGIIWTNLVEVHWKCYIPNIKAPCHPVSERKNFVDLLCSYVTSCDEHFEVCLLCSYVLTCDPREGASFDLRGIIWTELVEVHKEKLYAKYESSKPSSFREKEFLNFLSLFLCSKLLPPGWGLFWPRRGIIWTNLVE